MKSHQQASKRRARSAPFPHNRLDRPAHPIATVLKSVKRATAAKYRHELSGGLIDRANDE